MNARGRSKVFEAFATLAVGVLLWSVATLEPAALAVCAATIAVAYVIAMMYIESGASQKEDDDDAT